MRIKKLTLKNIGPFDNADIEFFSEEEPLKNVTIITGENGSGKSLILDSIRGLLSGEWLTPLERTIYSNPEDFYLELQTLINHEERTISSSTTSPHDKRRFKTDQYGISKLFQTGNEEDWIFDFWSSRLAADSFEVSSISIHRPEGFLNNSLTGVHQNNEVANTIVFFDYLSTSSDKSESKIGKTLFGILKKIISLCLNNGSLSHVSRINLQPIIKVNDMEISLEKLSSGNLYLIQRLVSLLGKAYSIFCLNRERIPIEEITHVKGVILIDEAENHLHPKWQKTFLKNIISLFPNLQIIVTTHSPFIVGSVDSSNVYVCETINGKSEILNRTAIYSNKSIAEILTTDLFNTEPYSQEITELLEKRRLALEKNNMELVNKIEDRLTRINSSEFSYMNIDDLLKKLTGKEDEEH